MTERNPELEAYRQLVTTLEKASPYNSGSIVDRYKEGMTTLKETLREIGADFDCWECRDEPLSYCEECERGQGEIDAAAEDAVEARGTR